MDSTYKPVGIKTGGSLPGSGAGTNVSRYRVTSSGVVTTVSAGSGVGGAVYTRTHVPTSTTRHASETSADKIQSSRRVRRETPSVSECFSRSTTARFIADRRTRVTYL